MFRVHIGEFKQVACHRAITPDCGPWATGIRQRSFTNSAQVGGVAAQTPEADGAIWWHAIKGRKACHRQEPARIVERAAQISHAGS